MSEAYDARVAEAIATSERFIKQAKRLRAEFKKVPPQNRGFSWPTGADNAAMKRTSMDLTKLLAAIRKGQYA